ncbi:substrate-binding domain-containing protein [Anaerolineales bacterium HSG6]|nr:substrate-binding domain-containing protein [Anaerolineales bacterium HSG6]
MSHLKQYAFIIIVLFGLLGAGYFVFSTEIAETHTGQLRLATTTSTDDSGLLTAILPDFERRYDIVVEVIAVGTGQAMQLGEHGNTDVLLVHARQREDAFVEAGFGISRHDVMYNDFVIIGPASDPAGIRGLTDVGVALTQIAQQQSLFISRGDDSGTHIKEQQLWKSTQLSPDTEKTEKNTVVPKGDWYQSAGQGMGAVISIANEQQAYTLSDRATYLTRKAIRLDLEIMVEGDSRLFNPYGVIAINPKKHPLVNHTAANLFIDWLVSLDTQQQIEQFGQKQFGQPLFVPNSDVWTATN